MSDGKKTGHRQSDQKGFNQKVQRRLSGSANDRQGQKKELTAGARPCCETLTCDCTRKSLAILLWEAAQKADADFRPEITPAVGPAPRDTKIC